MAASRIGSNESNISSNSSNIGTNSGNISTNTGNINSFENATFVGKAKWDPVGGYSWVTGSDGWSNFPTPAYSGTPTASGSVTIPNKNFPEIRIAGAKAGFYKVEVRGFFVGDQTGDSSFRLYNGSVSLGEMTVLNSTQNLTTLSGEVIWGSGDLNIKIQGRDYGHTGGDSATILLNTFDRSLTFLVYWFPNNY